MRYWDASALVSLLVEEAATRAREDLIEQNSQILTWWGSKVECASALNRLRRQGTLDEAGLQKGLRVLDELAGAWTDVVPTSTVRERAMRLLRVHPLRAADALQLAAALTSAADDPSRLEMVCGDTRLADAARKEGLTLTD
jgi:hypothetical protein